MKTIFAYALIVTSMFCNLAQAESVYKVAAEAGNRVLGPNNLDTAKLLNDWAHLCFRQGKYGEAETLYKWALASTEGAAGADDPLVAACLQDYAAVLRKLNRAGEADQMESRARTILSGAH